METDRVRFVTTNYPQLQGLRLVPLGGCLVIWAAVRAANLLDSSRVTGGQAQILTRLGFVWWIGLALAIAAPAYYRFRYGTVDPLERRSRDRWITAAVVAFFVLARVDATVQWPVSLAFLLIAVSLFVTACHDGWIRSYYAVPATAWLAGSFLPSLGGSRSDILTTLYALGGLTLIGCGIGDHRLLSRTLSRMPIIDDGHSADAI